MVHRLSIASVTCDINIKSKAQRSRSPG